MIQLKLIIISFILLFAVNFSHSSSAAKNTKTELPKGVIDLTAGDKPCFCPKRWGGVPFPANYCGKEIIKLLPNSDCKPEYGYQCLHAGERAIAVSLCPNTEDAKICGPLRPESFNFNSLKNFQDQTRECVSEKQLKGWILVNHNGEYTSWKYVGVKN